MDRQPGQHEHRDRANHGYYILGARADRERYAPNKVVLAVEIASIVPVPGKPRHRQITGHPLEKGHPVFDSYVGKPSPVAGVRNPVTYIESGLDSQWNGHGAAYPFRMSSDLSGEVTAIATSVLAAFAIVTALFAFLAYRKQAQEVGILLKQNEREADERRKAQAARVFTGAPRDQARLVRPYAQNASHAPVYDVALFYTSSGSEILGPDDLGAIMPGEAVSGSRDFSGSDAIDKIWLTFRDAAGVFWSRRPLGVLEEIDYRVLMKLRGGSMPVGWEYEP